jgi:tRNA-specific adenosine deaminase 2
MKSSVECEQAVKERDKWMMLAMEQARLALEEGEVPVGCVIVSEQGTILSCGRNATNRTGNASRHCEIEALNQLTQDQWEHDLKQATLFVTCEPCIMCAGAIQIAQIPNLIFGCKNTRFGGCGSIYSIMFGNLLS